MGFLEEDWILGILGGCVAVLVVAVLLLWVWRKGMFGGLEVKKGRGWWRNKEGGEIRYEDDVTESLMGREEIDELFEVIKKFGISEESYLISLFTENSQLDMKTVIKMIQNRHLRSFTTIPITSPDPKDSNSCARLSPAILFRSKRSSC
ncbi:unnamed protein product [Moneuplotes crassus]|uniref:Uncharacterized protein n=1 Tax=Euplotes crassus TaxID=5936 RepID=A0AAD2D6N7_EUPCR|nr:unnamed protein product [Moneuplotes crassus]